MTDLRKGLTISILVHCLVLGAVSTVWLNNTAKPKSISLDFSIINFETQRDITGSALVGDRHSRDVFGGGKENKKSERPHSSQNDTGIKTSGTSDSPQSLIQQTPTGVSGVLSEKDGQVDIIGPEGSPIGSDKPRAGNASLTSIGQSSGGAYDGSNEGLAIRYGSGGTSEKTFNFIREAILKNIRYPENARRKGFEGKILLSFIVMENGTIRDVRVINGSGFRDLDNSAQDAVKRTTFTQKIPYRLFVTIPIEFRLE